MFFYSYTKRQEKLTEINSISDIKEQIKSKYIVFKKLFGEGLISKKVKYPDNSV